VVVYCAGVSVASSWPSAFDGASPPGVNVAPPWRHMTQQSVATHATSITFPTGNCPSLLPKKGSGGWREKKETSELAGGSAAPPQH